MLKCKFCNSEKLVRNGRPRGIQRFVCKECKREQIEGDKRVKYEDKPREMAFILYTEGNGFRRISRILSKIFSAKFYYQTIVKWLKLRHKNLPIIEEKHEEIEILELDELYTYIKKNRNSTVKPRNSLENLPEYGLLWTEIGCVCVHLR